MHGNCFAGNLVDQDPIFLGAGAESQCPWSRAGVRALLAAAALAAAAGAQPLPLPTTQRRLPAARARSRSRSSHDFATPDQCTNCHSGYGAAGGRALPQLAGLDDGAVGARPADAGPRSRSRTRTPRTPARPACAATCRRAGSRAAPRADGRHAHDRATTARASSAASATGWSTRSAAPENPREDAGDPRRARRSRCPTLGNAMMVVDPLDRLRGPFDVVADLGSDPHLPTRSDARVALPPERRALRHLPQRAQPRVHEERRRPASTSSTRIDTPTGDPDAGLPRAVDLRRVGGERVRGHRRLRAAVRRQPGRSSRPARTATCRASPGATRDLGADAQRPPAPRLRPAPTPSSRRSSPHHPAFGAEVDADDPRTRASRRATDMLRKAATRRPRRSRTASSPFASRTRPATSCPTGLPRGPPHVAPGARLRRQARASCSSRAATSSTHGDRCARRSRRPSTSGRPSQGIDADVAAAIGLPAGQELPPRAQQRRPQRQPHPAARLHQRGLRRPSTARPVGATYADGQYWDDVDLPGRRRRASRAEVTLYYQTASREYVEFLRDEDRTTVDRPAPLRPLGRSTGSPSPSRWRSVYVEDEGRRSPRTAGRTSRRPSKRYRKVHEKEWSRCFETEGDGAQLRHRRARREARRRRGDAPRRARRREGQASAPARTCTPVEPRPRHLVPGALRLDHALRHDRPRRLQRSVWPTRSTTRRSTRPAASRRRPLPDTTPASAAELPGARSRRRRAGLAADATTALAKCETANASGKQPPVDCSQDPAPREGAARRRAGRSRAAKPSPASTAAPRRATSTARSPASRTRSRRRAAGYVGAAYP